MTSPNHPEGSSNMVKREAQGGFSCPICGEDKPHHHTPAVVDAYQNKRARK
jgi:hypothetical protein